MPQQPDFEFQRPWYATDQSESIDLRERVLFEDTEGHVLWGRDIEVIGRSSANDDVVVRLDKGEFAIVHLVWGRSPGDERWPSTDLFKSSEQFAEGMRLRSRYDD